jgi:inner membrane protein
MKAPTHILGGYVFAGTLCSFTDVNVFEKPEYIAACALFSILPDIDATKSAIGKTLYPVAWIINRKFGHRTITHSLVFLAFVWLVMFALAKFQIIPNSELVKIAVFATISHFVFDMITVSGIPLLFPFFKNQCVVPGNVNFRFKSGEWKSEVIITAVCSVLLFSMQPLFANGFWTSYNRSFGTIRHVDRENRNTEFYVVCEYSYILNAEERTGEAIVIDSKQNELILFDRQNIFTLNSDNPQLKINYARPRVSTIEKRFEELKFFNIPYDSLQRMLSGKLTKGLVQSNTNVRYIENAVTYHTNFINFSYRYDFQIYANVDSGKSVARRDIARLEASINQSKQRHQSDLAKYNAHFKNIRTLEDALKSETLSNYERNKLQRELITLRNRNIEQPIYTPPATQIAELQHLKKSLTENSLLFSGHLTVYTFGYDQSRTSQSQQPHMSPPSQVCYSGNNIFASLNPSNSLNSLNQ